MNRSPPLQKTRGEALRVYVSVYDEPAHKTSSDRMRAATEAVACGALWMNVAPFNPVLILPTCAEADFARSLIPVHPHVILRCLHNAFVELVL